MTSGYHLNVKFVISNHFTNIQYNARLLEIILIIKALDDIPANIHNTHILTIYIHQYMKYTNNTTINYNWNNYYNYYSNQIKLSLSQI